MVSWTRVVMLEILYATSISAWAMELLQSQAEFVDLAVHVYHLVAGCLLELADSLQEAVTLTACLTYLMEDLDGAILLFVHKASLLWGPFMGDVAHLLGHGFSLPRG